MSVNIISQATVMLPKPRDKERSGCLAHGSDDSFKITTPFQDIKREQWEVLYWVAHLA